MDFDAAGSAGTISFTLDGRHAEAPDDGGSLLGALRDRLGVRSPKDGCSPQGQCGCCTVLVDGQARVACVTPLRRVTGRAVTTLDGLDPIELDCWTRAFVDAGASQCGFCTPGIVVRLCALERRSPDASLAEVHRALAAHLCRCTGWKPIETAWAIRVGREPAPETRDLVAAAYRAGIEGRTGQRVGPDVAQGAAGFAADTSPRGALVAVPDGAGGWATGETIEEARQRAGKIQGRRTTLGAAPPLALPAGEWVATLKTCWTEPGYLETDASWCDPGGEPVSPLANGGAFGAKSTSPVPAAARELADRHGRPVLALWSREDTVRWGPKRPPVAIGLRPDGTGVMRVVRTPGVVELVASVAPGLVIDEVDVPGPPTSLAIRGAGWLEPIAMLAALAEVDGWVTVAAPSAGTARARVGVDGIDVEIDAGRPLDLVVLRSYAIGAAHAGFSLVTSEALTVDEGGEVNDLTVRSFGIVKAADLPPVRVRIVPSTGEPINGCDSVLAAVAAATWVSRGLSGTWPTGL